MPSKTKLKNAEIAARLAALPNRRNERLLRAKPSRTPPQPLTRRPHRPLRLPHQPPTPTTPRWTTLWRCAAAITCATRP